MTFWWSTSILLVHNFAAGVQQFVKTTISDAEIMFVNSTSPAHSAPESSAPNSTPVPTVVTEPEIPAVVKPLGLHTSSDIPGCAEGTYVPYKKTCFAWFSYPRTQLEHKETCAEYDMKLMDVETQEIFELLPGLVEQFILQKGYTMNWSHETSYSWWINMRVKRSQRPQNDQLVWRTQRLKFFDMETDKELTIPEAWVDWSVEVPANEEWGVVVRVRILQNMKFSLKLAPRDPVRSPTFSLCQKPKDDSGGEVKSNPFVVDKSTTHFLSSATKEKKMTSLQTDNQPAITRQNKEKKEDESDDNTKDIEPKRNVEAHAVNKQTNMEGSQLSQNIVNENNIGESGDRTLTLIVGGGGLMCLVISTVFVCFWRSNRVPRGQTSPAPTPPPAGDSPDSQTPNRIGSFPREDWDPRTPDLIYDPVQLRKALAAGELREMRVWKESAA